MPAADLRRSRPIETWSYADTAARDAATYTAADIGYVARVASPLGFFRLAAVSPSLSWEQIGGGAAPAPATLWTPENLLTAPTFWLDENFQFERNGVNDWDDRITRADVRRFSEGAAGAGPTRMQRLNRAFVRFSASASQRMTNNSSTLRDASRNVEHGWLFAVYRKTAATTSSETLFSMLTSSDGSSRFVCQVGNASPNENRPSLFVRRLDADSAGVLHDSADRGTGWQMVLWEMRWATGLGRIFRNGALSVSNASMTSAGSTSNTQSAAAVGLACFQNTTGPIQFAGVELHTAVARFSNAALTDDEIDRLFGWAAHWYSLADLLPTDHPFKSAAPTV